MELEKAIKERRSIRKFKKLDVPWYVTVECLDAARYAPSSGNVQNFRFVVVKENIKKIVECCDDQDWMLGAPILIIVCGELNKIRRMFGIRGEALYSVQNCALAIQNLILKAYELGLGSCIVGDFDEKKVSEVLDIKGEVRVQAIIALGYPNDKGELKREPLDNFVYFEKYGEREDKSRSFNSVSSFLKKGIDKVGRKFKRSKY